MANMFQDKEKEEEGEGGGSPRSSTIKASKRKINRETWSKKSEFLMSCLGYAVGYGNVWRFPYLCYKNGGAAFLIPYFIMLFCIGWPLFFMELAIGQYVSLGPSVLFPKLAPIFSGLGWGVIVMCFLCAIYYNMIIAWSFFYLIASFASPLPWHHCDSSFNSAECYSEAAAAACKNQSLYYHNRTCLSLEEYCGVAGLLGHNLTHCLRPSDAAVSVDGVLPRTSPSEDFFKNRMLGVTGKSWDDLGELRWELVGCLALAWVLVCGSNIKGLKSVGKVAYITATFPYIILAILLVRGITLEGSYQGLEFYLLKPDFTKLLKAEVWSDAAIQIFFSNAIGFGTLITLSSFNKFNNNCMMDTFVIGILNSSTSILSGFVTFSILGFLAQELGVKVGEVASSGSGLIFVVYPAALALLPLPQLWSVLFFIMLLNLGIGTQMSVLKTLTSALFDRFEFLRPKAPYVVVLTCCVLFLSGLTLCLEGGILMFELFNWYSVGIAAMILSFTQLIAIVFVYGYKKFLGNIKEMGINMPRLVKWYFTVTWVVTCPLLIMVICFFYIYSFEPAYFGDYVFPNNIQILGWFLSISSMSCIPLGIFFACSRKGKWRDLLKTSPDFCQAGVNEDRSTNREKDIQVNSQSTFRYTYRNEMVISDDPKIDP